jgi:hypothetical protein
MDSRLRGNDVEGAYFFGRLHRCLLIAAMLAAAELQAQSGGSFKIVKSTIDAGGGATSASPYVLRSTIGQADARYSDGGAFALRGGFWGSSINPVVDDIFHDGFD